MFPSTYQVAELGKGILSVMARPVPGEWIEEEFIKLKLLGIDKIVSLLETDEQIEIGLSREEELCAENTIEYQTFPIPDRGLPDTEEAKIVATKLLSEIRAGRHIVIHCRAGIGRTGIIAGAILIMSGETSEGAIEKVSSARGVRIPDTVEQEQWLHSL